MVCEAGLEVLRRIKDAADDAVFVDTYHYPTVYTIGVPNWLGGNDRIRATQFDALCDEGLLRQSHSERYLYRLTDKALSLLGHGPDRRGF